MNVILRRHDGYDAGGKVAGSIFGTLSSNKYMKTILNISVLILLLARMKFQHLIIAAVLGLAIHQAVAKSTPTNSFGIYLFAESEDWQESASNWTSRALSPTPVLSDSDILTYTFTNHLMTLTSEAAQRIARLPIPKLIEPFVVVVNGERIYRGAFVLAVCSGSVALPSITLWGYVQIPGPNLPTNSFFIERTYAAPFSKTGPDPRSDNRIRRALEMLHKLK